MSARGILLGVAIGALLWVLIFVVVLDWFGTSTMAELGHRAVESGVIP